MCRHGRGTVAATLPSSCTHGHSGGRGKGARGEILQLILASAVLLVQPVRELEDLSEGLCRLKHHADSASPAAVRLAHCGPPDDCPDGLNSGEPCDAQQLRTAAVSDRTVSRGYLTRMRLAAEHLELTNIGLWMQGLGAGGFHNRLLRIDSPAGEWPLAADMLQFSAQTHRTRYTWSRHCYEYQISQ